MTHRERALIRRLAHASALFVLLASPAAAARVAAPGAPPAPHGVAAPPGVRDATRILAVVNGDVITNIDVENRTRLFALSTGLTLSQDVLDRLHHQIVQQLIDERLRMQAIEKEKIVVPDTAIEGAIHEIEARNNLPPGALTQKLAANGVSPLTLIDQIRTQLGWSALLRKALGDHVQITPAEIAEQQRLQAMRVGTPEYRVGEIFIPVDDPSARADAERFAETVINDLRKGAPFGLVAAQFSQTETALTGGERGWVQPNQLDPAVAALIEQMPVGAVSNPVTVPGGYEIVTLQGKRQIGNQVATVLNMRVAFLPFSTPLNPQAPTPQQRQALDKARGISASVRSCDQMEQIAKTNPSSHPANPGDVQLDQVNPPVFRQLLATQPLNRPTQPLVGNDGISVVIVCSRDQKNLAATTPDEVKTQLLNQRVELMSQELIHILRRRATIDLRVSDRA
jgi:peptidyl-prolyl cis-trans isomerase SurA